MASIIGIDPGKTGGAVLLSGDGQLDLYMSGNDGRSIQDFLAVASGDERAVMEHQHAFPGQAKTNFIVAEGYGYWKGALESWELGFETVTAITWQKIITKQKGWDRPRLKKELVAEAIRRWPEIGKLPKGQQSGVADAALIAEFARTRGAGNG